MIRNSKSCTHMHLGNSPLSYWEYASAKIESYPATTKRLLNNDYYGGCRNHGSHQPYITCSKNKMASNDIRKMYINQQTCRPGKV